MRYLNSILRIIVLVAVVLAIANFSDVKKTKAVGCNITASRTLDNSCENQDVTISGTGVIVTVSGAHTFHNLTITNGATVTQEAIAISDIDTNSPDYLNANGKLKKVDLNITGTLSLTNQGKIDVAGKGFPGGDISSHQAGYGRGGGGGAIHSGAAYGGDNVHINGTITHAYGLEDQPTDNGSGGSGYQYGIAGAGGGVIKIHTNNMVLDYDSQTYISANGGDSTKPKTGNYYFGGSGGSIWLQVTGTLTTHYDPSYSPPSVTGNQDYIESKGFPGTAKITGTSEHFGTYIVANGGWSGGAGGRIRIEVANIAHPTNCNITVGDVIPAYCEGQDVTIDGTTVNADAVLVYGDSKRNFTNLTIENNGVLTHNALVVNGTDFNTVTSEILSTGQLKKVDLVITGDLILESGGKIDVSGKGYPGGPIDVGTYNSHPGYGSGGGLNTAASTDGYVTGGGGAYGGNGGTSWNCGGSSSCATATVAKKYPEPYTSEFSSQNFQFGSGGGAGYNPREGYHANAKGGAGGGRISIKASNIKIYDANSSILADGVIGEFKTEHYGSAAGGSGSGGTIWLRTNIEYPNGTVNMYQYNVNRGDSTGLPVVWIPIAENGTINPPIIYHPSFVMSYNIRAAGGNAATRGSSGGGGRIVLGAGTTSSGIQSRKVTVTVAWKENGIDKSVKLYSVLRSVVPTP